MKIEVLVDVKTTLGEGPLWDVAQQRLYWIDAAGCRVFRCTADGREVRAWDVPSRVGSIAIRKDGEGAICSLAKGFAALDFRTGEVEPIADIEPETPQTWINDGKVDRRALPAPETVLVRRDEPKALPASPTTGRSGSQICYGLFLPVHWGPSSERRRLGYARLR